MISLLHATRGTPERALATRKIWIDRADDAAQVEHIFGIQSDDMESIKAFTAANAYWWCTPHLQRGPRQAWQTGMSVRSFRRAISW